jgi:hypothetical protein
VVRRILLHIAAGGLIETPPAAEVLLTDAVTETLAEMLRLIAAPDAGPAERAPEPRQ